jgi:hypothetical protein
LRTRLDRIWGAVVVPVPGPLCDVLGRLGRLRSDGRIFGACALMSTDRQRLAGDCSSGDRGP